MLSREERILSELLASRNLVSRDDLERCADECESSSEPRAIIDALVDSGHLTPEQAETISDEARDLNEVLAAGLGPGHQLGDFRLIREIGRGGMGIVYEAEQESLGRRVAVKVLPRSPVADERVAIRFLRESRAAARLEHPGIVRVLASGQEEGILFFAMELVDGCTLADLMSGEAVPAEKAVRIGIDVARALAHAHQAGLVHRDVKPGNILIDRDGNARLADFGLVHELQAESLTLSHHVLGTPAYMAPEQVRGGTVDAQSDVYALGAALYATLGGQPPHVGSVPSAVLASVLEQDPPPLAELRPDVPTELVAICERAMARDPRDRHASAAELAEDLEKHARGEPPGRTASPKRSWVSGLVAALLACIGILGARQLLQDEPRSVPELPVAERLADASRVTLAIRSEGAKSALRFSPDGRSLAWTNTTADGAHVHLMDLASGDVTNLTAAVGGGAHPVFAPDGLSMLIELPPPEPIPTRLDLTSSHVAPPERADLPDACDYVMGWAPDGREVLWHGGGARLHAMRLPDRRNFLTDLEGGTTRLLTSKPGMQPSWSPRGRRIAFASPSGDQRGSIWTVGAAGGSLTTVFDRGDWLCAPTWSSAGTHLQYIGRVGRQRGLWRAPIDEESGELLGEARLAVALPLARRAWAAASADRRRLAVAPMTPTADLHELHLTRSGHVTGWRDRSVVGGRMTLEPDLSPDGKLLACIIKTSFDPSAPRRLRVVPVAGGDGEVLLTGSAGLGRPRWSPDGRWIAYQSAENGSSEIWRIAAEGGEPLRLTALRGVDATGPTWSPSGDRLAFHVAGRGGFTMELSPEGDWSEPTQPDWLAVAGASFRPSAWSRDGRWLAGSDGGVLLVHVPARKPLRRVASRGEAPVWVGDSGDLLHVRDGELHRWSAQRRRSELVISARPARVLPQLSLSRDGRTLHASLAWTNEEIWFVDLTALDEPDRGAQP